jgi:hypothetical protein
MDTAQTLLKMVLRAFYETRQIIVVDAVMAHSAYGSTPFPFFHTYTQLDEEKPYRVMVIAQGYM